MDDSILWSIVKPVIWSGWVRSGWLVRSEHLDKFDELGPESVVVKKVPSRVVLCCGGQ